MHPGVRRFVEDMDGLGFAPQVEAGLVIYGVEPVDGAHAGSRVETGVALDELAMWPQAPPHWMHFPSSVDFTRTNSEPSPRAGWLRHSRQIAGWGDAEPAIAWASHVRAVLSEAIT